MARIIGCRFLADGVPRGIEYSYYDGIGDLAVGELVVAMVGEREKTIQVTAVDVPESSVEERWLPMLKRITKRYSPPAEEASEEGLNNV